MLIAVSWVFAQVVILVLGSRRLCCGVDEVPDCNTQSQLNAVEPNIYTRRCCKYIIHPPEVVLRSGVDAGTVEAGPCCK